MKINQKLILGLLGISILVGIVGYIAVNVCQKSLQRSIGESSALLSQEIMDKIDRDLQHRTEEMLIFSLNLATQKNLIISNQEFDRMLDRQATIDERDKEWVSVSKEKITPFMQQLLDNEQSKELKKQLDSFEREYGYQVFGEIFVTNKYGAIVALTGKTSDYRQDDEEWWIKAMESGLYLGDIEYDKSADIDAIDIGVRIVDEVGKFLGVMKGVLAVKEVEIIIEEIRGASKYETINIALLTREGQFIYSTRGQEIRDDFSLAFFKSKKEKDRAGYFVAENPGESEELYVYAHSKGYRNFKGFGWLSIIEYETSEIFAPVVKLRNTLLAISLGGVLFAVLIALYIARSILLPIQKLKKGVIEIGKGRLDFKIDIRSNDEIGDLSDAFNKMASDLKVQRTEIEDLARFPDENPYPVMRLTKDGLIHYTNIPCLPLLREWGRGTGEIIPEYYHKIVQEVIESGKIKEMEVTCDASVLSLVFAPAGPDYINVYGFDITDRKRGEDRINQLGHVIDESHDEVYIFDAETLKFVETNKGAQKNLGYTPEELKGLTPLDIKPEFTYKTFEKIISPLKNGKSENILFETRHKRKDGTLYPVEVRLQISFIQSAQVYVAIILDITGRKHAEDTLNASNQQLRASNQQLKAALDGLSEKSRELTASKENVEQALKKVQDMKFALDEHSIVAITDEKGAITYVNDKFCEISKYSREELLRQDHRIINSGGHPKEFMRDLWKTISSGKTWKNEIRNKAKDGSYYWVDTTIVPFLDEQGKPIQYIAIRTDITERKKMEEALRQAMQQKLTNSEKQLKASNQQLVASEQQLKASVVELQKKSQHLQEVTKQAKKLAQAKSDFLANMSHEIRTPMNAILGFNDLLRRTSLDNKQKDYLESVRTSGELLVRIIDDILDVSKFESGPIRLEAINFKLENLIFDVFKMVVTRMKEQPFDTYVDIARDVPPHFKGDPTRLKQILVNLLGNAVRFTSQGEIGLIVNLEKKVSDNDFILRFTVKDTGIGIAENKQKDIFKSFTQADESTTRKFGGTGLGLSISKTIVERMGGAIWVKSELGKGSEFIFTVNLKKGEAIDTRERPKGAIKALKGKKVFIVDDNRIARTLETKCCEEIGFELIGMADSPYSALHKLDRLATSYGVIPDLILCDIMMEGMDGFELVAKIRGNEMFKDVKYIAVTADLHAETSKKATGELFDAYLTKPVSFTGMANTIKEIMGVNEEEEEEESDDGISCQGIKVLVVEDSVPNQQLIQAYFEELECEGDYAKNGKEAIEKLKSGKYDLCLMDIQMPIMGGIEATKIIREEISKDFPIIALTAAVLKEDREDAKKAGMNDFLSKPIELEKLREKILQYGKK